MKVAASIILFLIFSTTSKAEGLVIAVASSSLCPMENITKQYTKKTGNKVTIIAGSTGKLYSQITEGAPFDIFLSADTYHPELLATNGFTSSTVFNFATGTLALWTKNGTDLDKTDYPLIAMANPLVAPYGRAAKEAIDTLKFKSSPKIVYGESVAQAFLFAKSGNVDGALISEQTLRCKNEPFKTIDKTSYRPIKQSGVIIKETPLSISFRNFLLSKEGKILLESYGYRTYTKGDRQISGTT